MLEIARRDAEIEHRILGRNGIGAEIVIQCRRIRAAAAQDMAKQRQHNRIMGFDVFLISAVAEKFALPSSSFAEAEFEIFALLRAQEGVVHCFYKPEERLLHYLGVEIRTYGAETVGVVVESVKVAGEGVAFHHPSN